MTNDPSQSNSKPPILPTNPIPELSEIPSLLDHASLPAIKAASAPSGGSQTIAILLSLCLGLFLADGIVSFLDDSMIVCFNLHILSSIRVTVFLGSVLMSLVVYGLIGLTPSVPKAQFLPLTLFSFVAQLAFIPCLIYFFDRMQVMAWAFSFGQVLIGLGFLYWIQGGLKFRWKLVEADQVAPWRFSWVNLFGFILANLFILIPAVIVYLIVCVSLAVGHISDGFMSLHPDGIMVRVTKYVRNDGKTIQLVPMSHIGEPNFYRTLSQSFPSNGLVLMEGISDNQNLITNKFTYKRTAASLGLAEQQKEFNLELQQAECVNADIDVEQFAATTIQFLNLASLLHSKGVNAETLVPLLRYSSPPEFQKQLFEDILRKRNRHLLQEIKKHLAKSDILIVPWGVAHMPEVAQEIQKSGFQMSETHLYPVVRFGAQKKR